MANVTQLKHLEHLEDEMLNYGVEGCKSIVSFLKELRKMLGCDNSTGFMQTKWDGAPAIVAGPDPKDGKFFVGTKSVFNKKSPKVNYTVKDIEKNHKDFGLQSILIRCLNCLPQTDRIFQGDFIGFGGYRDYKPNAISYTCLLYTSPSPRDLSTARMPSSA